MVHGAEPPLANSYHFKRRDQTSAYLLLALKRLKNSIAFMKLKQKMKRK
jgi:hypothetical protein